MVHAAGMLEMHKVQNGEPGGKKPLGDVEAFFYMAPCLSLQLHVNGSTSLLQCSFVLLLNFFDISIKTMQCLFIQVNG
jgi:hypothetical protein